MLQNIGDTLKTQKWLAYIVLGALILVFAAWGAYGIVDVGFGSSGYAAKVNGEEISLLEANEVWQQQQPQLLQTFGGELTEAQRNEMQQRILDGQIRSLVATQQARKLGFRVTDEQLLRAYQSEPAFQIDGVFNAQAARSRLASVGLTEAGYEADLRESLLSNQLASSIAATDFLTPLEVQRLLSLQDEQRELRYVLVQPEPFEGSAPIAAADIEAWYNANPAEFTLPEAVKLSYAELSLADVAQSVVVSDEALQQRYETARDTYVEPERRRARHILTSVDGTTDEASALAASQAIHKRLLAGEDFATLAKQLSKDSASAAEGGDLGWSARDAFVGPFADALFALKEGETTEPVKTQFGYHIIRLDGIRTGAARSFEEVKPELAVQLRNELAAEAFGNRQEELQTRVERGGASLAQLAQEFGLRTGEVERFERGAGGLPLGSDAELNREVFNDRVVGQRLVGGPIPLGEDRLTLVQVVEHQPPTVRPLAEVRDAITATLIRKRGSEAAAQAAEAALARLAAGEALDKVARDLKSGVEGPRFVSRTDPELPVELRDAVFALPKPKAGAPQRSTLSIEGGGAAIVEVASVRNVPASNDPQILSLRAQREQQRYSQRDIEAYVAELVKEAKVVRNPAAFQQ